MLPLKTYPNLDAGDRISVVSKQTGGIMTVYFESQSENAIEVHDYVPDCYITIYKSDIAELFNDTKQIAIPLTELTRNVPFNQYRMFEFINKQHEENYDRLLQTWPQATKDKEYGAATYILALPMIFAKFASMYEQFESPVTWIADYEYKYNDKIAAQYDLSQEERDEIVIDYDLTTSMKQLGQLALHLFNGYEEFNLLDCISCLDMNHYHAFTQAIEIRR